MVDSVFSAWFEFQCHALKAGQAEASVRQQRGGGIDAAAVAKGLVSQEVADHRIAANDIQQKVLVAHGVEPGQLFVVAQVGQVILLFVVEAVDILLAFSESGASARNSRHSSSAFAGGLGAYM
jgi:hypothetical protein